MPLVVVALAGQGASVRQFQVALRPFKCLDRRLSHRRTGQSRSSAAPDRGRPHRRPLAAKSGSLLSHQDFACRPGRSSARAASAKHTAHRRRPTPRDQWPVPARKTLGRRLVENLANALVSRLIVDRRGARPQPILQPIKAFARVTDTPQADRGRRRLQFAGDLPCRVAVGRLQHDPYPQQLSLLGAAGAQARLKDRAISPAAAGLSWLRLSCLLESRCNAAR